jgi:predicted acyl esterase
VRFEPAVTALLQHARESGDFQAIQPYLRDHSTNALESGVTTPTLVLVSYHDGFFNQNAALRQIHNVPASKRIVLYPGGHSLPPDDAQEGYVMDVLYRWLDYWLKDETALASVASPDSTAAFFDGGTGVRRIYTGRQSERWLQPGDPLPQGIKQLDLYFDENGMAPLPPANRSQRVITYINVLGSTPIAFRTPPMEHDLTVLPPPGSAHLRVQATGPRYQMNVLLYDVDPTTGVRKPMNRGHLLADDPNIERDMIFDLTSILHTVRAGHAIEVLVNGGTALIPDQSNNFGNYVLGPVDASSNTFILGGGNPSRISLYVEDDGTVAVAALPSAKDMRLFPSWPNPAVDHAVLSYELRDAMSVCLTVHDAMGRAVAVVAEGFMTGGLHRIALPTTTLPNGMYFYRLTTERGTLHGKFLVTH